MTLALAIVLLAIAWAVLTGVFTLPNVLLGGIIGALVTLLFRDRVATPKLFRRIVRALALLALFLREVMVSALRVALLVISPNLDARLKPGIIAFPLSVTSDLEIALLANLITLTPGTLSVDVSEDRKALYIHALVMTDKAALIAEIAGGFEARVRELFA